MSAADTADLEPPPLAGPDAPRDPWPDLRLAARLLAVDPSGLGGARLQGGPGPARDLWLAHLRHLLPEGTPWRRLPAAMTEDRLYGGLDLAATLSRGTAVLARGLLAETDGGLLVAPMAERLPPATTAALAECLDTGRLRLEREGLSRHEPARFALVALDESEPDEAGIAPALAARLAFDLDLRGVSVRGAPPPGAGPTRTDIAAARRRLAAIAPPADDLIEALVAAAAAFGIETLRPPLQALRAARAMAALAGHDVITPEDAADAARLVYAPRALIRPDDAPDDTAEPPPPDKQDDTPPDTAESRTADELDEVIREAVSAALPPGLLAAALAADMARGPKGRGAGTAAEEKGVARGRPAGARAGRLGRGARIDIVATLRTAAPWQPVRRQSGQQTGRLAIRPDDIRIRRLIARREATIVFCVDASGSTAMQRLGEAKGAVELLLADAYVARTQAALVAFRGTGAEILLPPTRSLARARARLAALPGGGGTPLSAGLEMAALVALGERRKGRDPLIVVLTDGSANIGRDGKPGRQAASADAQDAATAVRLAGLAGVFIDTSPRPRPEGPALAEAMGARYVALPYLDAGRLRDAVTEAREKGA